MDSYFEIKALPNPEIIQSTVMATLMETMHRILPKYNGRIGLGFPAYGQLRTLGGVIRVLGSKQDIESVYNDVHNNNVMSDYAVTGDVAEIPRAINQHVCYKRQHARGNSRFQRQKKRHLQRGSWSDELEQTMLEKLLVPLTLPHVTLNSASTGQKFPLFIKQLKKSAAMVGSFNTYGLCQGETTIPMF